MNASDIFQIARCPVDTPVANLITRNHCNFKLSRYTYFLYEAITIVERLGITVDQRLENEIKAETGVKISNNGSQ